MLPRNTSASVSLRRLRSGGSPWILVPLVPAAAIVLRRDERLAIARHVAHAGRWSAALAVHALGILAARHLEAVVRAWELHLLHRAGRDELEHRAAPADEVRRAWERLNRGDAARDRQRDLRILRPERMLRPDLG